MRCQLWLHKLSWRCEFQVYMQISSPAITTGMFNEVTNIAYNNLPAVHRVDNTEILNCRCFVFHYTHIDTQTKFIVSCFLKVMKDLRISSVYFTESVIILLFLLASIKQKPLQTVWLKTHNAAKRQDMQGGCHDKVQESYEFVLVQFRFEIWLVCQSEYKDHPFNDYLSYNCLIDFWLMTDWVFFIACMKGRLWHKSLYCLMQQSSELTPDTES